jgi:hypothetical protein
MWCLIVPRGRTRLVAVQCWFAGGRHRDYLILTRPASRSAPGSWWARSLSSAAAPGDLDLRRREDARKLESLLGAIDLDALDGDRPCRSGDV